MSNYQNAPAIMDNYKTAIKKICNQDLVSEPTSRRKSIESSHPTVGSSWNMDMFNKNRYNLNPNG